MKKLILLSFLFLNLYSFELDNTLKILNSLDIKYENNEGYIKINKEDYCFLTYIYDNKSIEKENGISCKNHSFKYIFYENDKIKLEKDVLMIEQTYKNKITYFKYSVSNAYLKELNNINIIDFHNTKYIGKMY